MIQKLGNVLSVFAYKLIRSDGCIDGCIITRRHTEIVQTSVLNTHYFFVKRKSLSIFKDINAILSGVTFKFADCASVLVSVGKIMSVNLG